MAEETKAVDSGARGVICVFAKPPYPGRVKTRLASEVGARTAAALARAFFDDTWARVSKLAWARPVLASTHEDPAAFGLEGVELWLQGEGDLGQRLERVMRRALQDAPWAIALGADSPAIGPEVLEAARDALATHDAALGPAEDGGYYLLGLRRMPAKLLGGLPWSSKNTFQSTHDRLRSRGLSVAVLEPGFDVDEPEDLRRLWSVLRAQPKLAPKSLRALRALDL